MHILGWPIQRGRRSGVTVVAHQLRYGASFRGSPWGPIMNITDRRGVISNLNSRARSSSSISVEIGRLRRGGACVSLWYWAVRGGRFRFKGPSSLTTAYSRGLAGRGKIWIVGGTLEKLKVSCRTNGPIKRVNRQDTRNRVDLRDYRGRVNWALPWVISRKGRRRLVSLSSA